MTRRWDEINAGGIISERKIIMFVSISMSNRSWLELTYLKELIVQTQCL